MSQLNQPDSESGSSLSPPFFVVSYALNKLDDAHPMLRKAYSSTQSIDLIATVQKHRQRHVQK